MKKERVKDPENEKIGKRKKRNRGKERGRHSISGVNKNEKKESKQKPKEKKKFPGEGKSTSFSLPSVFFCLWFFFFVRKQHTVFFGCFFSISFLKSDCNAL